ncbi:MAG TPA: sigma-70 family RNA polymerase sigma factor [Armatimonadota bacterium]|nr:sigma-70 family RNA polymerase sigma factor [Armatimonadota bacterium]HOM81172.1 sigma-70 family RNA polymerase sigma factor [Armatimonadota bacterium]HPO73508.1 sigma-70 family RNA polymerase sigma factor [Armatimonadota bacterium]HPT96590.1 sigma-70 family RNA polymerase sigma factor [Armatimonadota bacterium]
MESDHLWRLYKETGDLAAREELILRHAFLVRCVADRLGFTGSAGLDRDDVISYGIIGLIDAVEKYGACPSPSFESYARLHIREAILNAIRARRGQPRSLHASADAIEQAVSDLQQRLGRHPTMEEVSAATGLSEEEIERVLICLESDGTALSESGDLPEGASDNLTLMPPDNGDDAPSPADPGRTARAEQRRILIEAIRRLPPEERLLLSLYYIEELTLPEIGQVMNLPEAQVSQIHTKAMMRLRAHLRTQADLFAAA